MEAKGRRQNRYACKPDIHRNRAQGKPSGIKFEVFLEKRHLKRSAVPHKTVLSSSLSDLAKVLETRRPFAPNRFVAGTPWPGVNFLIVVPSTFEAS
jgi:hypothetical protein